MAFNIGSIKINGTEYIGLAIWSGTQIVNDISNRTGTAQVVIQGTPALLGEAVSGSESSEVESSEFESGFGLRTGDLQPGNTLEIFALDASRIFSGLIATVTPNAINPSSDGLGTTEYTLAAQDYCSLLDGAIISTAITYTSVTDASIIADLLTTYAPSISSAGVDSVATVDSITFDNISVRQALENLILLTGAQFWVDPSKVLQYHAPTANPAPFAISETTDGVTTFQALKDRLAFSSDFSNAANRVKVIGALASGSTPYSATANNAGSQGYYGIRSRTIVDRNLGSNTACLDRANVELATYGTPQLSGSFATFLTGLAVGQALSISWPSLNVSGTFLVRRVQMTWQDNSTILSSIQFGDYRPDLPKFLRKLALDTAQPASAPVAIPAPFSVTPVSFAGTIQPVLLVPGPGNPTLPDATYPIGSIIENVTDLKLYKNIANAWVAVVNLADLPGQIGTTQISNSAITTPLLAANAVTATNIAAASITSAKIAANAVVAGTIAVGAIVAGDGVISNLAINTAQIISLSASKLTAGTIDASVITVTNLNATNITTGTLSFSKIGPGVVALGAGSLELASGIIALGSGGAYGSISGNGSGISLLGGTGISIAAGGALTIGSGGLINCAGQINGGYFSVGGTTRIDSSGNGLFAAVSSGGNTVADSGGQLYAQSAIQVAGVTVVGTQKSDIGAPSFASLSDVQTWCAALRTSVIRAHGLTA